MVEAVDVLNFLSTSTVMVFKPSIPAICPPEAVAVTPSTSMSPVE